MDRECRGIACIINIFQVARMKPRRGTDVDRDRLMELFQKLHFRVKVFNDEDCGNADVSCILCVFVFELPYVGLWSCRLVLIHLLIS